jgi:adenylate cyclase
MGASVGTAVGIEVGGARNERLELARRVDRRVKVAMYLSHGLGAIDLFLLMFFVLPLPEGVEASENVWQNVVGFAVYLPLSLIAGNRFARRISPARSAWVAEQRDPSPDERAVVLGMPLHCLRLNAGFWFGALVLFSLINLPVSFALAGHVATTIALGGITTCAVAYLLVEKLMQPMTEIALDGGAAPRPAWPGVKGRLVLAWVSATASPLLGLVMVACSGLTDPTVSREALSRSVLALSLVTIVVGFVVTLLVARSVALPLKHMRRALARVEAGDFAAEVRVTDASEVGMLQNGFNRMVDGLRDREHVKELYSRQVGRDVADASLDGGTALGGEVCDVAVLFVDMVGSTALAQSHPPEHVVDRLNRFFAIVVEVVAEHGGWVNKFEGDAALCVFGAPVPLPDPASCALAAGRGLHERLRDQMPSADAGIGLSAGPAVAGWIGAEQRFEYTVIGDPVNEAARLCELAKRAPGRLLASEAIVDRADRDEAGRWSIGESTLLRGRAAPTRLAAPA